MVVFLIVVGKGSLFALPEYSIETSQPCSYCHKAPEGGGALTKDGISFQEEKGSGFWSIGKILYGLLRFIHIFFGVLWFGTILYVHLVLRPAYASGGLPKSEVKVGVFSMIVMGITGLALTLTGFDLSSEFFHTKFGLFLGLKIFIYLVMVSSAVFVVTTIGPKLHQRSRADGEQGGRDGVLTLSELKQHNGIDGAKAYIGFNGKVYDVTGSKKWKKGVHFKQHSAGIDLTNSLKRAPHDEEMVKRFPVVGILEDKSEDQSDTYSHIFYTIAYGNLTLVILLLLLLSFWKL